MSYHTGPFNDFADTMRWYSKNSDAAGIRRISAKYIKHQPYSGRFLLPDGGVHYDGEIWPPRINSDARLPYPLTTIAAQYARPDTVQPATVYPKYGVVAAWETENPGVVTCVVGFSFDSWAGCSRPAALPNAVKFGIYPWLIFINLAAFGALTHAKIKGCKNVPEFSQSIAEDMRVELHLVYRLVQFLDCSGVEALTIDAPAGLQRNRRRRGKTPLYDYHVLNIHADGPDIVESRGPLDEPRRSPRSHLRRGHMRQINEDHATWVNPCVVKGRGGWIEKEYQLT